MAFRVGVGFVLGWLGLLLAVSVVMAAGNAQEPEATDKPVAATKPLDPSFVAVADEAGLPRVLIIGDSISMGYTLPVRKLLAGKANVHRPPANCGDSARGLRFLDRWLETDNAAGEVKKWDVIVFNFGLHDLKYLDGQGKYVDPSKGKVVATPEAYGANLQKIVERLQKTGAKLVWVTTTPVPAGTLGRIEGDEVAYNAAAAKVMAANGVAVDDLYAIAKREEGVIQRAKNVHFTDAGYDELAHSVADSVVSALTKTAK